MSANTAIEWFDHSWSPWGNDGERCSGSTRIRMIAKTKSARKQTVHTGDCDWLDPEVPVEWLAKFLQLIHDTPNLTWLPLTKRPKLWLERMEAVWQWAHISRDPIRDWVFEWQRGYPPPNVWVGTSVEGQKRAGERIPALLRIPAAGRFLGVEPLLGPVRLEEHWLNPILAFERESSRCQPHPDEMVQARAEAYQAGRIHWVIIGGESGPGSRPCYVDWIRSLASQCKDAGVAAFVKQLGAHIEDLRAYSASAVRLSECWPDGFDCDGGRIILRHPKGGDPAEWPEDLRVREFPEGLR